MKKITTLEQLKEVYDAPLDRSLWKEIDHINDHYRMFIESSPFLVLATTGKNGIDCSPRGDPAGFVRVISRKQLLIPDRRGNNRLDSLKNILANPNVGIIFLIPNVGESIRVAGKAEIVIDQALCDSFGINGKPASSVVSITVDKIYYQCQKAIARSRLWDSTSYIPRENLPTAGQMSKEFADSQGAEFDDRVYDAEYPEYMKKTIY